MKKYLDTYALAEIAKGNKEFSIYLLEEFVITDLTLVEFYAMLLREDGEKTAEYWFRRLEAYAVSVPRQILKEAIIFRYQHRKQNISFFDAAGYIYSLRNSLPFVTGDKEFEKLPNVEFRKGN